MTKAFNYLPRMRNLLLARVLLFAISIVLSSSGEGVVEQYDTTERNLLAPARRFGQGSGTGTGGGDATANPLSEQRELQSQSKSAKAKSSKSKSSKGSGSKSAKGSGSKSAKGSGSKSAKASGSGSKSAKASGSGSKSAKASGSGSKSAKGSGSGSKSAKGSKSKSANSKSDEIGKGAKFFKSKSESSKMSSSESVGSEETSSAMGGIPESVYGEYSVEEERTSQKRSWTDMEEHMTIDAETGSILPPSEDELSASALTASSESGTVYYDGLDAEEGHDVEIISSSENNASTEEEVEEVGTAASSGGIEYDDEDVISQKATESVAGTPVFEDEFAVESMEEDYEEENSESPNAESNNFLHHEENMEDAVNANAEVAEITSSDTSVGTNNDESDCTTPETAILGPEFAEERIEESEPVNVSVESVE